MTKITIDIDLEDTDYNVHENEMTVSESLMEQVVEGLTSTIKTKFIVDAAEEISKNVERSCLDIVTSASSNAMEKRLTKNIDVDGAQVNEFDHKVNSKIDEIFNKKNFDSSGCHSEYRGKYTAFELFSANRMDEIINKRIEILMAETMHRTEAAIADKIKENFAQVLTDFVMKNQGAISLSGFSGVEKKEG